MILVNSVVVMVIITLFSIFAEKIPYKKKWIYKEFLIVMCMLIIEMNLILYIMFDTYVLCLGAKVSKIIYEVLEPLLLMILMFFSQFIFNDIVVKFLKVERLSLEERKLCNIGSIISLAFYWLLLAFTGHSKGIIDYEYLEVFGNLFAILVGEYMCVSCAFENTKLSSLIVKLIDRIRQVFTVGGRYILFGIIINIIILNFSKNNMEQILFFLVKNMGSLLLGIITLFIMRSVAKVKYYV